MGKLTIDLLFIALSLTCSSAWAYGGGGGTTSCAEAKFYDESPAKNAKVQSLSDIAIVASDNTDITSLEFEVNGQKIKPKITMRRSGEFDVKAHLPDPITQPSKIRIAVSAKSKEGCLAFFPYFISVGQ